VLNLMTHEAAAKVCLHAADYAEFLKTSQALVQMAFPAAVVAPSITSGSVHISNRMPYEQKL
jgi:hypothetical protein